MLQNNSGERISPANSEDDAQPACNIPVAPALSPDNVQDNAELIRAAREVRNNAYARYSKYAVGAAVRTIDGRIFVGCNVENASFGLTVCAERNAIFAAVAAGAREIIAVAVVTRDGGSPCGACRQVIAEFRSQICAPLNIILADETGAVLRETTIAELLPLAFDLPS